MKEWKSKQKATKINNLIKLKPLNFNYGAITNDSSTAWFTSRLSENMRMSGRELFPCRKPPNGRSIDRRSVHPDAHAQHPKFGRARPNK